ncbi:mechanosensitive ion channel family protein [Rhodocaloribacter litoris]|uniref:mechanosensitive ion channel family protein n=1 Tax=Rhodocaloribacter litoris TaxID=2558931 RepID=UPI00141F8BAE|nr:mechanosensitive ion channel family protein [Rhodocaloribacter litoris]QXD15758.1 mechanosensitive ion channel family protein [Rhodocaloribacter litoris]GIV60259.1 MAG: mechanosensitive ion channel protein MscS [Rhodothermaceae bacterium]
MNFPIELENEVVARVLLIVVTLAALYVLTRLAQRLARRYVTDPARLYSTTKTIRRTAGITAIVLVILLLSPDVRGLLTVLTVIGAGLAIALREALLSFAGWFRITFLTPFKIGDRIEINGVRGDVIDVRVLRTTLMEIGGWVDADQSTGRIVHIPNSWIFEHALYNYTRGFRFIWNELSVTVTFRSDWQAAHDILLRLANISAEIVEQQASREIRQMSGEYLIHYGILSPFVYVRIVENGIRLTLRYLCEARKRRGTEHALTISMLEEFKRHGGIELAYPTLGISKGDTPQFGPLPTSPQKPRPDEKAG